MYATLVTVKLDATRSEDIMKNLHDTVVPRSKQAPGFVRGTWFGDGKRGHGLILFESEEQAQDMASHVSMDPGDPVQIESTAVYKVNAEA